MPPRPVYGCSGMPFNATIRQFTVPQFAAYLATLTPPDWAVASCLHHTESPTENQWIGLPSMKAIQRYYEARGWTSGPHCFLALGSPNSKNDGIWVMTPPTDQGTHAGPCNTNSFGLELVGSFDVKTPSLPQQQLVIDTLTVLHRWAGLSARVVGHRDCMPDRSCPGSAYYAVLPSITTRLAARLVGAGRYVARHSQAIFEAPAPDARIALNDTAVIEPGTIVDIDDIRGGWAHRADGLGFIPAGVLSRVV